MASLTSSFSRLTLKSPATSSASLRAPTARVQWPVNKCGASTARLGFSNSIQGTAVRVGPARVAIANAFEVFAKQNSLKRVRTSETKRLRNKARKSKVATLSKKVFVEIESLVQAGASSEEDFKQATAMMHEAYQAVDKAVKHNNFHKNNGARKKSKMARARRDALIKLGIYTPASA